MRTVSDVVADVLKETDYLSDGDAAEFLDEVIYELGLVKDAIEDDIRLAEAEEEDEASG